MSWDEVMRCKKSSNEGHRFLIDFLSILKVNHKFHFIFGLWEKTCRLHRQQNGCSKQRQSWFVPVIFSLWRVMQEVRFDNLRSLKQKDWSMVFQHLDLGILSVPFGMSNLPGKCKNICSIVSDGIHTNMVRVWRVRLVKLKQQYATSHGQDLNNPAVTQ